MRIFLLLCLWMVITIIVPFWAAYQPNPVWIGLIRSPVFMLPWCFITLIVLGGVIFAPEEV